jgi:hypothetical protein
MRLNEARVDRPERSPRVGALSRRGRGGQELSRLWLGALTQGLAGPVCKGVGLGTFASTVTKLGTCYRPEDSLRARGG